MGSLLPLLLSIPVVMAQARPTLGTPVRGRELCTSLVTPLWKQEKTPLEVSKCCWILPAGFVRSQTSVMVLHDV